MCIVKNFFLNMSTQSQIKYFHGHSDSTATTVTLDRNLIVPQSLQKQPLLVVKYSLGKTHVKIDSYYIISTSLLKHMHYINVAWQ